MLKYAESHSIIRQPSNPTLFPMECWFTEVLGIAIRSNGDIQSLHMYIRMYIRMYSSKGFSLPVAIILSNIRTQKRGNKRKFNFQ